jgi:HEAT repeat protein
MNKGLPLFATPLLFSVVLLCPGCGGEPQYQGKTAAGWVAALEDPDPEVKANAQNILADMASKDKSVFKTLIQGMKNGNYAAAELLGEIGKDAGPVTEEVVKAMGETMKTKGNLSARLAAARAVSRFGTASGPAIPALIDMLKDDTSAIREMACETLAKLPVELARQATPALMNAAKNDVHAVQVKALETLRIIDPDALKKAGGS